MNEGDQMKLYTSTGTRKSIQECNALNIGLLMVDVWRNPDQWPFFAVDNGCYAAHHRQEDWNPAPFLNILTKCKKEGRKPEFIVIPDIPMSSDSLNFSKAWMSVLRSMFPSFSKYLAVQDGTLPENVEDMIPEIDGIFIGGSMGWKMDNLKKWVDYAHEKGICCHVGRIGPIQRMLICELAGADSIDSTTWVQNRGGIQHYVGGFKAQTHIEDHEEVIE